MSYPVFYVPAGDVLPVMFTSYDGGTGASVTLTGLAVTDIEIYKDGGVTQRASDAGYTLLDTDGIDFDGITGIHGFSIDTGDNTDAGFYTVGSWFTVVVSSVTVDAQTVNFIACQFRLMPAESVAGKPKVDVDAWLGTAAATPTVAGVPEVDVTHFNGTAGTFASGRPEVNASHISGDSTTADRLELLTDSWATDTAQAGNASTITLAAGASATTDIYKGAWIFLAGGTGAGQGRKGTAYNGTTKVLTITPDWAVNPSSDSVYVIVPEGLETIDSTNPIAANVAQWNGTAVATPSVAGVPEVDLTHVAGATTNVSALATNVDAIKAKTDHLTFTVANQVDSNAKSMNDTAIAGTGTAGDLWRG